MRERLDASLKEPYFFGPSYTALVAGPRTNAAVSPTPTGQPDRDLALPGLVIVMPGAAGDCRGVGVYAGIRVLLVRGRLGSPEPRVVPRVTCPEGVVEVMLAIEPRKDVQITACFAELRAEVTVEKGYGRG